MSEANAVDDVEHVVDHVIGGLGLLTTAAQRPAVRAVLSAWLAEVQAAESAVWSVWSLTIDTAEGDALDQLGAMLAQGRVGMLDAPYRAALHAKALAIRSSGTGDELAAVAALLGTDVDIAVRETFPATIVVTPSDHPEIPTQVIHDVLAEAKAGGVRMQVFDLPVGPRFRFSSSDATTHSSSHGFGAGHLAGVIE